MDWDAKYKHLADGQAAALRFQDLADDDEDDREDVELAGHLLSPADVRQLTVYAELAREKLHLQLPARLMLLYPFVGPDLAFAADSAIAWNHSPFWLVPVRVTHREALDDLLPPIDA